MGVLNDEAGTAGLRDSSSGTQTFGNGLRPNRELQDLARELVAGGGFSRRDAEDNIEEVQRVGGLCVRIRSDLVAASDPLMGWRSLCRSLNAEVQS